MDKRFIQILCFISLISFNYSAEHQHDEQSMYDPIVLFSKTVKNFHFHFKKFNLTDDLQFPGFDVDFNFTFSGLHNASKCMQDILYTVQNIKSEWGLKMIDSYGKPESGILQGNVRWIGDYNECIGIQASNPHNTSFGNFRGKYCSLTWSLKSLKLPLPLTFVSGVCIPDTCSADELQEDALQLLQMAGVLPVQNNTNSTTKSNALQCKQTDRQLNAAAKAMIALISFFCLLTVVGSSITIVKYFKNVIKEARSPSNADAVYESSSVNGDSSNTLDKQGIPDDEALLQDGESVTERVSLLKNLEKILTCFCVFTNGAKLLNTASSEGELVCIHGIRFLSMSWVILGHTYAFGFGQMRNMVELMTTTDTFLFQGVLQAFYSVDSFFVLSGFLLAFLSMKQFSKTKGKISWPYFYIHRYLRLTPMYMVLLGFSATAYLYMGSGPYWTDDAYDKNCRDVWWKNLLYINNFDDTKQCMGWSWYLANDMQFFVISPLFLITLWRWPVIGYCLIEIFLIANFLCNFLITYKFDLTNGIVTLLNNGVNNMGDAQLKFADYFKMLYTKPYTRIGPYLVGILAGYLLFKRKASNAPKHSLLFLTIGWIIASAITLATVYGLYHTHPGLIARSFYNALSRVCFAAGLCWVMYVCLIGQGGFINSLLSFKLFIPLSRLTYAAYLVHPMVISGYFLSLRTSIAFSHDTIVALFLGFMLVTYALALPVALILESPIVVLEKMIRKSFTKEEQSKPVD